MSRLYSITFLILLSVAVSVQAYDGTIEAGSNESERLFAFLETVYQRTLSRDPELAFKLGELDDIKRWSDRSAKKINGDVLLNWLDLNALHNDFDYTKLNEQGKLNYRAFEADMKLRIKRHSWRLHLSPINQIVGLHLDIPGLLTKSFSIENEEDANNYISMVRSVDKPVEQFILRFQERESKGFFLSKSVVPRLVQASKSIISGSLQGGEKNNLLVADFKRKLAGIGIDAENREKLLADLKLAIEQHFIPSYQRLIKVFEDHQRVEKGVNDEGAWRLPDGQRFYQFLLEQFTTTTITADEIHELGLKEVARIHKQMNEIREKVEFTGDLKQFFTHLKTAPQFYYPNDDKGRDDYLRRAEAFVKNAEQHVTDILPAKLQHKVVVRRIEPYREKSAPVGFYEAGTADGRTPGTVFLGMYDMTSAAKYDLSALLAHEGIPGHHLQLSVMQSQKHIPNVRKYYIWWSNTAFTEGWALYAEFLAREMGLYNDPYSEFGRLAGELWRACRLVVDSGLHAKRWSRQQAIDYLNENTASSVENNERAVDRYLAVPGQATAFKIGMMKILELRKQARAALRDDFDIRGFHYAVLKNGPVPLSLVEEEVQTWIKSKRYKTH